MKTICNHHFIGRNGSACKHPVDPRVCSEYSARDTGAGCKYDQIVGSVCSHGHLDRQCPVCERDARIAGLEAARDDALEQASDFAMQDEARRARIAELEAEVARCRAVGIDPDEWHRRLASAREAGAREFAEWLTTENAQSWLYWNIEGGRKITVRDLMTNFLASGTGNASEKGKGGE